MKTIFLNNAPHPSHGIWANSINSIFIDDRVKEYRVKNLSRLTKSLETVFKIPKDAEFVLCESASQLLTGILWKINHRNKKLGLIVSDPKYYHMWKMTSMKKKLYIWMLKKVDIFICSSQLMKDYLPEECRKRAFVVPPAFNREDYKKIRGNINSKNIIFTARICLEKGVDHLVDVFLKVKEKHKESKLYLMGASSYIPGQGNLREQLESRKLKNIIFTGHVDTKPYLKKCSIYVNLAWIEPASVSVIQAMCTGIVPIVNKNVGNKTYVEMIDKELVVNSDEQAERMILKLWKNKKLLERYSKRAIEVSKTYPDEKESIRLFREAIKTL
ncbi:MAG: glycosyltransferase family 4 protein [Nanoarchaeota archaeon]